MWRIARHLAVRAAKGEARPGRRALPPLLFFTDPERTPEPAAAAARLPRGAGVVMRTYGAAGGGQDAAAVARIARRRGLVLVVAGDPALARRLGAHGIHFPEARLPGRGTVAALRRRFLVTAAAHSASAARRARLAGADAVILSKAFPSASPSPGAPLGPVRFAARVRQAGLPVYALGGITARTARRLGASGAAGLAAVEAIAAPQPGAGTTR